MADIYTNLTNFFGGGGEATIDRNNPKVIYRTTSKEDYIEKKKELIQSNILKKVGTRVVNLRRQNTMVYEGDKESSYRDFQQMEHYPLIARALDIYSEESTTPNKDGQILTVHSENYKIKNILESLFHDTLDIHSNIFMWIRNLCKYGNNFLYLEIEAKKGITNAIQLPNSKIDRLEGYASNNSDYKVEFHWRGTKDKFKYWQIAHFRLLFDDKAMPYGMSILEKVRRTWKNLLLAEDAMRVYRILRAPERRVFKINVGGIDPDDLEAYMNETAAKFKRNPMVDPFSGNYDTNMNIMSIGEDIFIPVRDGSDGSSVETLAGASNLDQIADLEYDIKQLVGALGIPKAFLNYEDAVGDGQNLAIQDVRFARTVNRIQQSFLRELNKIAQIHLYSIGLQNELGNFTLSLNNPSTQSETLRIQELQEKISTFRDATSLTDVGFSAYSITKGMKEILGMSDEEIKLNLEQQRLEKAASVELENTANTIVKSGVFDRIDKLYGMTNAPDTTDLNTEPSSSKRSTGSSGGGGSSSLGSPPSSTPTDSTETEFPEIIGGEDLSATDATIPDDTDIGEVSESSVYFDQLINTLKKDTFIKPPSKDDNLVKIITEKIKVYDEDYSIDDIQSIEADQYDIDNIIIEDHQNKFKDINSSIDTTNDTKTIKTNISEYNKEKEEKE